MFRCLKYLLFLVISTNQVLGQILPFKNYTAKDGLISDHVTAVTRDKRGLLWVGTPFGVNWFDGNHITKPEIKIRTGQLLVTNFFKDRNQNIWILSFYNGLYRYNYSSFKNFLPDSTRMESNSNNVLDMLQYDDQRFLITTDQNVFWFDGKNFSLFDKTNSKLARQINTVNLYQDKWLLFGHSHGIIVYELVNKQWIHKGRIFENTAINKIFSDHDNLWIASDAGLFLFSDDRNIISGKPEKSFFIKSPVRDITKNEKTGELWIASDKLYRLANESFISYDLVNGLPAIPSRAFPDEEGIIWMCSYKGVIKMADQHFSFYNLATGPTNAMITDIANDAQSNLWFGTYDGIGSKKNDQIKDHRIINGERLGYIAWLKNTSKYGLLVGADAGIFAIKDEKIGLKIKLKTTKMFEDDEGVVWTGTEHGRIFRIENDSLQEVLTQPFLGDYIDALYKDKLGNLWVGYRGSGIRKYAVNGNRGQLVREFSTRTGYNDLRVRCSHPDQKGNILFGTRTNGVLIISIQDNDKTWHINTSKGLSANWVRSITNDQYGNLYLGTNQGVNILSGSYDKPSLIKLNLLNDEPGEQATSLYTAGNKFWIGTEGGLIEYFPQVKNVDSTTAPVVYFTEVSINGIRDSLMQSYTLAGERRLKAGNNIISFEFAGIYHAEDAPLLYRYKLEGQDNTWTYAGERNFVSYNLPPGNYTFKVQSSVGTGEWSQQPATFGFVIPAPFWKQWWFISVIAVALISLLFLSYRYKVQQALKLERMRQRISSDLHDDIGSTLSSISILSDIASKEKDQWQSGRMMQEIKQSSVTLMEKMDDIVWSINPQNDTMENLMIRIKRFASRLFEARDIDYTIEIDDRLQHARPGMETRQHIYLIMKEVINNLVKYSDCTQAYIGVKYENKQVQITIRDNGRGFDPQSIQTGNGMISMKNRARLIGAELSINSQPGKGAEFILQTKIK